MPKNRKKKAAQTSKSGGGANLEIRRSAAPPTAPTGSTMGIAGALLGLMPNLGVNSGDHNGPKQSLLDLGDEAHTMLRPQINARLKENLADFWKSHGIDFALYWLMKSTEDQKQILRQACPDMLESPRQAGEQYKPTDLLLPEFCIDLLLAQQGRALVALCQTRALEDVEAADQALIAKLDSKGIMPIFSGMEVEGEAGIGKDAFENTVSFVHNGKIVSCSVEREGQAKCGCRVYPDYKMEGSRRLLASGKVLDANQWITRNVRQTIVLSFCCAMGDIYLSTPEAREKQAKLVKDLQEGTEESKTTRLASVSSLVTKLGGDATKLTDATDADADA